jgi:hypothetical protein
MTNSTRNGKQPEMVKLHSHCIVFCGWLDCEGDHGDYCERLVGSIANGSPDLAGHAQNSGAQ